MLNRSYHDELQPKVKFWKAKTDQIFCALLLVLFDDLLRQSSYLRLDRILASLPRLAFARLPCLGIKVALLERKVRAAGVSAAEAAGDEVD